MITNTHTNKPTNQLPQINKQKMQTRSKYSKQSTPPVLYELDWKKGKKHEVIEPVVVPEQVIDLTNEMEPTPDLIDLIDVTRIVGHHRPPSGAFFDMRVSSLLTSIDKIHRLIHRNENGHEIIGLNENDDVLPYQKLRMIAELFFFISVYFPEANKHEPERYDVFVDKMVDKIVEIRPRIYSYRVFARDAVETEACESAETALVTCERMMYRISKKLRPLSHLTLQQIHGKKVLMQSLKMMVVWCCCSAFMLCVVLCLM
jgi:hypothetical protein